MNTKLLASSVITLIAAGIIYLMNKSDSESVAMSDTSTVQSLPSVEKEMTAHSVPQPAISHQQPDKVSAGTALAQAPASEATSVEAEPKSVPESMPSVKSYRDEANKNPHESPASYKKFADMVADRFSAAKNNEAESKILFDELKTCAMNENAETNLKVSRAFCARMAQMLSEKRTELSPDWYELFQKLPSDIKSLIAPI